MVQQPAVPFAQPPSRGGRKPGLIAAGALVLAAGVIAGLVMVGASASNYDDGVVNLARAPIGCTTTLEFDQTGTFTVYVETRGEIGRLRGDCPGTETDYSFRGDDLPDVEVALANEDGDSVDLDDDVSKEYDAAGAVGRSISSFVVEAAGEYTITVSSDDDDFAIAIGKDPKSTADSSRTNGMLVLAAGLVLGIVLLFLGLRRGSGVGAPPSAAPGSGAGGGQPFGVPMAPQPPFGFQPAPPTQPMYPPTQPMPPTGPPTGGPQWPAPPST